MTWAVEHMDPNDPDTQNAKKVKDLTCTDPTEPVTSSEPVTTEESGFLTNFLSVLVLLFSDFEIIKYRITQTRKFECRPGIFVSWGLE